MPTERITHLIPVVFMVSIVILATMATAIPSPAAELKAIPQQPGIQRKDARLTLPELITLTLRRNLRMYDSAMASREKEHQRRSAYSEFFPTIDVNYTASAYRYMQSSYIGGFSATLPSVDPFQNFSVGVTLNQPVYSGGRSTNSYKDASLSVDHSVLQNDVDRQNLTLDVVKAYYQLVRAERLLRVANASITALEAVRKRAANFFREGMSFKADVLSAEAQLAQAGVRRTRAFADIDKARAKLNLLLRNPQRTDIQVIQNFGYSPTSYKEPGIFVVAANNRVEIRQAGIAIEQAVARAKVANSELLPKISAQITGIRTNGDWNVFDPLSFNDWSLQGVFSWSFDMFRKRETVKERRVSQTRSQIKQGQVVDEIMEEVANAFTEMKRAASDIKSYSKEVELRRENFRVIESKYTQKMATYIEILEAERQLFQAEADYYGALIEHRIAVAELERKMGVLR